MSTLNELIDRCHDLKDVIKSAISRLVDADYNDGNHPVVDGVISDLRNAIGDGDCCCACGDTATDTTIESSYCGSFCQACFAKHCEVCGICADDSGHPFHN